MIKKTPELLALRMLIVLFCGVLIFHVFVIVGFIPFSIIWGGKMKTHDDMLVMEGISIGINLLFLGIVFLRFSQRNNASLVNKLRIAFWLFFVLFSLNTLGNLFAETLTETLIFTPLTILLAVLSLRLALKS
ncbi:MAG: hypothetical protein E6Q38_02590 [Crocinitomicaceae bacterium]|nr:MAG: hypothetical protein E6Q38_02590 [Crocinitomicaceae bacterium]